MCGIALLIGPAAEDLQAVQEESAAQMPMQQMLDYQQHRGPNSSGQVRLPWGQHFVAMGSRRLKILDPSPAGDQPMQRQLGNKRGWLSYNGELYNAPDLRNELLRTGCSFRSSADTEVVLYALLHWGKGALGRFVGMFALAYWEQTEAQAPQLLLARDRWGQKPLYYTQQGEHWLAASELQALLASGLVKKVLNEEQVFHYLRYKYARRPQTFYAGIQELEPGHFLLLHPTKPALHASFIQEKALQTPQVSSDEALLDQVEELLTDALLLHLQSDKAVGLFLSGGVDSTLMLALLRQHAAWQLPLCFTMGSSAHQGGWGTQDALWAEKAAKQYEAYHYPLPIEADAVLSRFKGLAQRQDQPIGDGAWLLTNLLSEMAADKVKVVLSGAGADELFAGYNRHSAFAWYLRHQKWLQPLLPLLKSGSTLLPTALALPGRAQWQLAKKFSRSLGTDPYQTFLQFTSLAILGQEGVKSPAPPSDWLQWALQHDRQHYLISDVLALNDKASMQWGLEMRQPYLNAPLTDFVASLPADYLLKGGKKWILKSLLSRHGGKAYGQRRKEGFGPPFGAWIRQGKTDPLWQWLQQVEHPLHALLPIDIPKGLLEAHRSGKADNSQELMALALLAHWLEEKF